VLRVNNAISGGRAGFLFISDGFVGGDDHVLVCAEDISGVYDKCLCCCSNLGICNSVMSFGNRVLGVCGRASGDGDDDLCVDNRVLGL